MVLLALALASFACADVISTKEADERHNAQITDGKLEGKTKFENVPADEDRLIKDMETILVGAEKVLIRPAVFQWIAGKQFKFVL
jgi:hypothetical protein